MSNVGYATLQVIPSFKGAQAALTSGITGPSQAAGQAAGLGFGAKFAAALKSPAGIVTAAVGAAAFAGKALYDIGAQFDDAYDTIRVGTGATGKDLEGLKRVFKGVVTDVPTDFASASQAVSQLNQRLDITGKPLRKLSGQFLELSRITKTDLGGNIEQVTRVFGDWGIATDQQGSSLDKLFRASQASGVPVAKLGELMVRYGAPLRQFGFGFDEAAAMLAKFEKEGVNTELVMGSMRIALNKLASEGFTNPKQALADLMTRIREAPDALTATALAGEYFGRRAGADMAAAIREGRFSVEDLLKVVSGGSDTILKAGRDTEDFGEKWTRIKNRVLVALEPIATRVFDGVGKAMDLLGPHVTKGLKWLQRLLSGHGAFAAKLRPAWNEVRNAISTVVDFVTELWSQWGDDIVSFYETYFKAFIDKLRAGFQVVKGIFDVFAGILSGDWSRVWDGLKSIFSGIWDAIVGTIRQGVATVVLIFSTFGEKLLGLGKGALTGLWNGMKAVWSFVRTWVIGLPLKVVGFLASLPGRLLQLGSRTFSQMWSGMRTVFGVAAGWLRGLPGHIVGFLGSLPGRMLSAGQGAIRALWSGFESLVLWIGRHVGGFVNGIVLKIGEIISGAYNVGKSIVEGLWNGWFSLVDWIIDKAKNFAWDIIDEVLGVFGIGSPSKVFAEMGRNLARGLAAGWADEAPGVTRGIERHIAGITLTPRPPEFSDDDVPRRGPRGGRPPAAGLYIEHATFGDRDVLPDLDYFARTKKAGG